MTLTILYFAQLAEERGARKNASQATMPTLPPSITPCTHNITSA